MAVIIDTNSLTYVENSMNVTLNQTQARYLVKLRTTEASHNDNNITTTYYIDGIKYTQTHKLPTRTTTTVVDRTVTITHNADGKKTISANFSTPTNISAGVVSGSQTLELPIIPRASSFTISKTAGGSSASEFTLGEVLYVNITRASSSFTHKVSWKVGDSGWRVITNNATTSTNFTLDVSNASYIPSSYGTATIEVDTYNGSSLIGSATTTFKLNVPSSVKPTISSVVKSDTANLYNTYGAYVQGKSNLRVQTTATAGTGASITSYTVQLKSGSSVLATKTGSDVTFSAISFTGSITVEVTVVDSRGRSATNTSSITVAEYSNPKINTFTVTRNSSTPSTVFVSLDAEIKNINSANANAKSAYYRYKKTSQSESYWTTVNLNNNIINYAIHTGDTKTNIDENSSYDFEFVVEDSFATTKRTLVLSTSFELINYGGDGKSIAFGKVAEISGSFECGLNAHFKNLALWDASANDYFRAIERIHNTNGTAVKFSDGTMICWYTQTISGNQTNFNNAYGSIYLSAGQPSWTYPVAFNTTPTYVNATLQTTGIGGSVIMGGNNAPSTTTAKCWNWNATSWSGATLYVYWLAIGRWR